MEMVLEHLKLLPILLMMFLNQKHMPMEIKKLMQELRAKPFGPIFFKVPIHQEMQYKMDKETHSLIHGLKVSLPPENIILLITNNIFHFWILFIINLDYLRKGEMRLALSYKEQSPIMKIQIIISTEIFHSTYNKPDHLKIIHHLPQILKLSIGE